MMRSRGKHLGALLLTQFLCVAVGLWMQHRFITSSLHHAAEEKARTELVESAGVWSRALLGTGAAVADLDNQSIEHLGVRFTDDRLYGGRDAMLLDRNGRIAARSTLQRSADAPVVAAGIRIDWKPLASSFDPIPGVAAGTITLPDGDHLAVAYPVQHGAGRFVVHRSMDEILGAESAAERTLPMIGLTAGLWTCVLLGISVFMITARIHDRFDREHAKVKATSLKRIQTLVRTQDAVIFGLAKLADSRDPETGDHLERITVYSSTLASAMRSHPQFADVITPAFVRLIGTSSALHDIGKVGVEDGILLKPGPLTRDERARMKRHTTIGGDCLREIERRLGSSNFLQMAREIALAHHEHWDGCGYPAGLSGEAIPLPARIVALCDVYDALSSRRVYKAPIAHAECVDLIRQGAGRQFDPDIVDVWLTVADHFHDLARRYSRVNRPTPEDRRRDDSRPAPVEGAVSRL